MLTAHYNFATSHLTRRLGENQAAMSKAMEKISTGLRINTASDGPSDLIISEKLRSQIAGLERAMQNASHTSNVLGIAEGGLGVAQDLIQKMKKLALASANSGIITKDQLAANQAEMDSALQALGKIFGTTQLGAGKLLENLRLGGAIGNSGGIELPAANIVATPETFLRDGNYKDLLDYTGVTPLFPNDPQVVDGVLVEGDKTFVINGLEDNPDMQLEFAEGESIDTVLARLREITLPENSGGDGKEKAANYRLGDDINRVDMDVSTLAHLQGLDDAEATAFLTDYLNNFADNTGFSDGTLIKLSDKDQAILDAANKLRDIGLNTVGGLKIANGLDENGEQTYSNLTLNDLFSGGAASLERDPLMALKILEQAAKDVASTRASIGVAQAYASQDASMEALIRAESGVRDADFAYEVTEFTHKQIQTQVCMNLLSTVNKQYRENMINLLG